MFLYLWCLCDGAQRTYSGFLHTSERISHRGQLTDENYTNEDGRTFPGRYRVIILHADYSTATGNIN